MHTFHHPRSHHPFLIPLLTCRIDMGCMLVLTHLNSVFLSVVACCCSASFLSICRVAWRTVFFFFPNSLQNTLQECLVHSCEIDDYCKSCLLPGL